MSSLKYGECPRCHGALTLDHHCPGDIWDYSNPRVVGPQNDRIIELEAQLVEERKKLEASLKKKETCSICGRGPHLDDDPECVAGTREIHLDAKRYRLLRSLPYTPLVQGKELDAALDAELAKGAPVVTKHQLAVMRGPHVG